MVLAEWYRIVNTIVSGIESSCAASADRNISIDMGLLDANTLALHSCITHSSLYLSLSPI